MNPARKFFLIALYVFLVSLPVFSQVGVEPEDEFYSDAFGWEFKGIVERLPQLRPYPVNVIYDILTTVASCEDPVEKRKAEYYLERYFSKNWNVEAAVSFKGRYRQLEKQEDDSSDRYSGIYQVPLSLYFAGDLKFGDYAGFSFDDGAIVLNDENSSESFVGKYTYDNRELRIKDCFLDFSGCDVVFDLNGMFSFGSKNLYGTIGLNRTGLGYFPSSSIAMNPSAYQALNGTFNYRGKYFDYSQYFGMLGAWNKYDSTSFNPGKFLSFHSIKIPFANDRFFVSYFESVVYGKTFNPVYFMPVPYVIVGNVDGFDENVLGGLQLDWKPVDFLMLSAGAIFDDMQIKQVVKLKLNEASVRTGFSFGVVYTPIDSICNLISFNYDMITPYCYSYFENEDKTYNFHDYTNCGIPMGLSLPPNSDRISLKMNFKPVPRVHLSTQTTYIRHANPYQSLEDEEVLSLYSKDSAGIYSDGSVKANEERLGTALDYTDFLRQGTIMYVMQAAFNLDIDVFRKKTNSVILNLGYTFEYIRNNGVDDQIYSGTYSTVDEVKNARKTWEKHVSNLFNHYFAVSAKVYF